MRQFWARNAGHTGFMKKKFRSVSMMFVSTLWLVAAATGLVVMTGYSNEPGDAGATSETRPEEMTVSLDV